MLFQSTLIRTCGLRGNPKYTDFLCFGIRRRFRHSQIDEKQNGEAAQNKWVIISAMYTNNIYNSMKDNQRRHSRMEKVKFE